MRLFAWALMAICAFTIGCDKPAESLPPIAPSPSSGMTDTEDHSDHDHGASDNSGGSDSKPEEGDDHDHAEGEDHDHDE